VDYEELRETVKSIWRKRHPTEQLKIIGFILPKDDIGHTDYYVLPDSNYRALLDSALPSDCTVVFYELEGGYCAPPNTPVCPTFEESKPVSAVFNEYIVCNTADDNILADATPDLGWNLRLNSILFV
ncbi:hypothetical protein LPJ59_005526, partial [Coemansia sp. RSA 2399]